MDGQHSSQGGRLARSWREATRAPAWRGERALAVAAALLANALAALLLLRAPGPPAIATSAADSPIEVVWIARASPSPQPVAVPAVPTVPGTADAAEPRPAPEPTPTPGPVSEPDASALVDEPAADPAPAPAWRGGQIPPDEPAPPEIAPGDDENGRPIVAGPDARERAAPARPGVFDAKPDNPFVREDDGPYRMQDNSVGGRLQRMARRSTCGELRARLRAGGADIEAIVRAMAELRCT